MKFYGGYTFSWPDCLEDLEPWTHGVVVTPRYIDRMMRDRRRTLRRFPTILDNGAWAAYQKGESQTLEETLASMEYASKRLGYTLKFVVVPDVVGDADASMELVLRALPLMASWHPKKRLLVVQEGADLGSLIELVEAGHAGGLFVGGADKDWKKDITCAIRALTDTVYLHVGRIATVDQLEWASRVGVHSFDNTTFLRKNHSNVNCDHLSRVAQFCERRDEQSTPTSFRWR